jgi:NAD(P)-dependent dehydrogenase (short-subunit alcohol dehydrogenase family)
MVCARTSSQLEQTVTDIHAAGGHAAALVVDITVEEHVRSLANAARDQFGGVDILVNNAGNYIARFFQDYAINDWRSLYEVNVIGTVRVIQAILPMMIANHSGRIINVASTASKWGAPGQSAYNASKHAVLGLTRALALETASQGVRVTAVCPWWVDTELIPDDALSAILGVPADDVRETLAKRSPIGRLITPQDVAELIVFLSMPESDAINGIGITVAGGALLI